MSRPRLRTLGDGRNAPQGTDLPRAVGEKRRQRHFGIFIFSKSKRSSIGNCVFVLYKKRNVKLTNQYFKNNTKDLCPKVSKGRPESPLVGRWGKAPYSKMLRQLFLEMFGLSLTIPNFITGWTRRRILRRSSRRRSSSCCRRGRAKSPPRRPANRRTRGSPRRASGMPPWRADQRSRNPP